METHVQQTFLTNPQHNQLYLYILVLLLLLQPIFYPSLMTPVGGKQIKFKLSFKKNHSCRCVEVDSLITCLGNLLLKYCVRLLYRVKIWFRLMCIYRHILQFFSYIITIRFIGGGVTRVTSETLHLV